MSLPGRLRVAAASAGVMRSAGLRGRHRGRRQPTTTPDPRAASRRVVGWATADHPRTELIADALRSACRRRRPSRPVIFRSDRDCQYTSRQFTAPAAEFDVRPSVGRTGQCWDNALAASFSPVHGDASAVAWRDLRCCKVDTADVRTPTQLVPNGGRRLTHRHQGQH
ncbi:DDE-type integrase/transposase/recombinase [Streptomyces sp. NPDC046805]|uniref:DDE-type integrase/transposase/recombinase n=1 Tax=Streptomyces sp. NPDC046805 TaxID=3155134 RepID=UPI0033FFDB71